jgi:hypothetical protein
MIWKRLGALQEKIKVSRLMIDNWGSTVMVSRGIRRNLSELPGFLNIEQNIITGITYCIEGQACEIRLY